MSARDLEKLLGGYAPGTLTEEERTMLFEAALHDQDLFNTLADEHALKELLDDPVARRQILASLKPSTPETSTGWFASFVGWFRRPTNLALAGSLTTALIAFVVVTNLPDNKPPVPPDETLTAKLEARKPSKVQESAPPPLAAQEEARQDRKMVKQQSVAADDFRTKELPERQVLDFTEKPTDPKERISRDEREKRSEKAPRPAPSASPKVSELSSERKQAPQSAAPPANQLKDAVALKAPPSRLAERAQKFGGKPQFLQVSFHQPIQPGPARDLFHAVRAKPDVRGTRQRRQAFNKPSPDAVPGIVNSLALDQILEEHTDLGGRTMLNQLAAAASRPLGLRYSVQQQGAEGTFHEVNPEGPFTQRRRIRLTVEVNEPGFLYVFRQGPRGKWTRISTSGPGGAKKEDASGKVGRKIRYVIPGTGMLPVTTRPSGSMMLILFSRQARHDLQLFHPAAEEGLGQEAPSKFDLATLLKRERIEASTQPLVIEKVHPGRKTGTQEYAIYVVNPLADQNATIALDIAFPTG